MYALLNILHLLALVFGAAASLGNVYLMLSAGPHDLAAPGFTNQLRKLYRLTALGAIGIFWITGILMLLISYGFRVEGFAFTTKIALVVILTISVAFLNFMAPRWARGDGPPPYVKTLHWLNAGLLLIIVILAPLAF